MNNNVKRNMIQVRLTDEQLKHFMKLKRTLKARNNAAAIRELILQAPLNSDETQQNIKQVQATYDDLEAQVTALTKNSTNITANMNQVAHAANVAKNQDPANAQTWTWVVRQLQSMFPAVQALGNASDETKQYLKETRASLGRS